MCVGSIKYCEHPMIFVRKENIYMHKLLAHKPNLTAYQLEDKLFFVELSELVSGPSPSHWRCGRLVLMVVSEERGRTVYGGHHGLETTAFEFMCWYLTHRRGVAGVSASRNTTAAAVAATAAGTTTARCTHGRLSFIARRCHRCISAVISYTAAAAGWCVWNKPGVNNVPGRFSETRQQ